MLSDSLHTVLVTFGSSENLFVDSAVLANFGLSKNIQHFRNIVIWIQNDLEMEIFEKKKKNYLTPRSVCLGRVRLPSVSQFGFADISIAYSMQLACMESGSAQANTAQSH